MVIPFEINETVYVVEKHMDCRTSYEVVGCDHLGLIGEYQNHYFARYEIKKRAFSLSLLGQYGIDGIFKTYQDAQAHKKRLEAGR